MRKAAIWILIFFIPSPMLAQVTEPASPKIEQQLENLTANNENSEAEDDTYIKQMTEFIRDPVNLNTADETMLQQLQLLTPIQINSLIIYRRLVGDLLDIYELQAVPGWDIQTIQKLRPYISVSSKIGMVPALMNRFRKGEHYILLRGSQVLERSKGYLLDSSTAANFYPGSPQKILLRYTYSYKHLLRYGIVAEKDAGEQFFKGKQKAGFDFYSIHIFTRNLGVIRSLAIGDFTVNLGQGLVQWQSLAFKKSADVINIKREGDVLSPYTAAGEINFHRGLGITLARKNRSLTLFVSWKKTDANLVVDSTQNNYEFVSSLQTSGYHRTKSEQADKGVQNQLVFGGNFSYRYRTLRFGINAVEYSFKQPLIKSAEPYNQYALSGKSFGNYSVDYSYTFKNIHIFGEAAVSSSFNKAFITGLIMSASASVDLSILYRNISRAYQSLYTSAFTENTYPSNEKGLYAGISIRPGTNLRIDAYADLYAFPWLRYRVDAPAAGADYQVQVNYKPGKQLEIYSRFHAESKAINANSGQFTLTPVLKRPKKNWRTQLNYMINKEITVRSRVEMLWFDKQGPDPAQGFLCFFDFIYKPMLKPWSANLRLQYFETDNYDSRLYAYENDVLYSFSIPAFYNKGYRYYLNLNYNVGKKISLWIRWAQTLYRDVTHIGSGLDEITGSRKTEVKIQAMYKF